MTDDTALLAEDLSDVTADAAIACVRREVAMRATFYARRVRDGKMKAATAEHEQRAMRAVLKMLLEANSYATAVEADTANWPIVWQLPEDCADQLAAEVDDHTLRYAHATWQKHGGRAEDLVSACAGIMQAMVRLAFPLRNRERPMSEAADDFRDGFLSVAAMLEVVEREGWDAAGALEDLAEVAVAGHG